jgi:nucleotide-binding universal stress UspA family protein
MNYKKILIAADNSEQALWAAHKGFELAGQLNAECGLIYVIDKAKSLGNIDAGIMPEDAQRALNNEADRVIDSLLKQCSTRLTVFKPEGSPVEEVIAVSRSWAADLIVIGTHARTGLRHLLLGSVAEHLIRHSAIPVLVVKAPQKES